jgi:hypothetical protein
LTARGNDCLRHISGKEAPSPLYSIADDVDGGGGAGWDGSDADCSAGCCAHQTDMHIVVDPHLVSIGRGQSDENRIKVEHEKEKEEEITWRGT